MNRRHIWVIAAIGLLVTAAVWWPHSEAASQNPGRIASESARSGPEADLEQQTQELVQQYRNAGDTEDRDAVLDDLQNIVSDHFDLRQESREAELEQLEREIERLRSLHERRQDEKDRIVQRRIESLLREADGLGWGSPHSSSIRSLDSQATVGPRPGPRKELSGESNTTQWDERKQGIAQDLNARFEAGELTAMEAFEEGVQAAVRFGRKTEEEAAEVLAKLGELTEEEVEKAWREEFAGQAESNEWEERKYAIAEDLNARLEAGELTALEALEEALEEALRLSGATEEEAAEKRARPDTLTEEEAAKKWQEVVAEKLESKEEED